jgi:hypothetical protein
MATVSFPDFQKCLSHQIASVRRQCKEANKQRYDAGDVMEQVHVMFINITRIAGCTPACFGESHQRTEVLNAAETSRNLHLLLKGKPLCKTKHEF